MAVGRRRRPKAELSDGHQSDAAGYYSKAIGRALDVLECFKDGETTLSLMEISKMCGFPESSLFRILITLEAHRYLHRTDDGSYRLAPKLLLGKLYERAETVRELLHPYLKQLNSAFNETVSMAFLFEERIQVLDTIESFHDIRITNTLGRVLPPQSSSLGKAITAFQPKEVIDRILNVNGLFRRTERTLVDRSAVLQEFDKIRSQGYAEDREESTLGKVCFGAPVFDQGQRAIAAISISTPLLRMDEDVEKEMIRSLLKVTKEASKAIQMPAPVADA
ncbi:MAG: IclR family transcriptional regulator [Acidobacteriota bacterium]